MGDSMLGVYISAGWCNLVSNWANQGKSALRTYLGVTDTVSRTQHDDTRTLSREFRLWRLGNHGSLCAQMHI